LNKELKDKNLILTIQKIDFVPFALFPMDCEMLFYFFILKAFFIEYLNFILELDETAILNAIRRLQKYFMTLLV